MDASVVAAAVARRAATAATAAPGRSSPLPTSPSLPPPPLATGTSSHYPPPPSGFSLDDNGVASSTTSTSSSSPSSVAGAAAAANGAEPETSAGQNSMKSEQKNENNKTLDEDHADAKAVRLSVKVQALARGRSGRLLASRKFARKALAAEECMHEHEVDDEHESNGLTSEVRLFLLQSLHLFYILIFLFRFLLTLKFMFFYGMVFVYFLFPACFSFHCQISPVQIKIQQAKKMANARQALGEAVKTTKLTPELVWQELKRSGHLRTNGTASQTTVKEDWKLCSNAQTHSTSFERTDRANSSTSKLRAWS